MNSRSLLTFFFFFLAGIAVGIFFVSLQNKQDALVETASKQIRQMGDYTYINPLLECEVAEGTLDARKENFHDEIEEFAVSLKEEKKLTDVAVYFRDLNNGPTFGVNDREGFFPASLLKVPIMMTYYRLAEREPSIMEKEIFFDSKKDLGKIHQNIVPQKELLPGESYSIEELIERMIMYSDNQATFILASTIPKEDFEGLFEILGLNRDILVNPNTKLTVKEYASFFRILFNSSYLSTEYSEKALKLLDQTSFSDALEAGVPKGIPVAHKFGEVEIDGIELQFHDCGVVYFPGHPYLACVMTRGHNAETLKDSIADISKFIYQKIDEQY